MTADEVSAAGPAVSRRGFIAGAAAVTAGLVVGGAVVGAEPAEAAGNWVTVCKLSALKVGHIRVIDPNVSNVKGLDRPVALTRTARGTVHALDARCTHQGCTVGIFANKEFVCPCHGSTFTATGHRIQGPAPVGLVVLKSRVVSRTKVQVFINPATSGGPLQ